MPDNRETATFISCDYVEEEANRKFLNTLKLILATLILSALLAGIAVDAGFFHYIAK